MFPLRRCTLYGTPKEYQPPKNDSSLAGNLDYPNLNSRDYASRPLNRNIRMHIGWECLTLNEQNHAILGTNKISGREWTGSLWGFENVDDIKETNQNKACFKLQCSALITSLQYLTSNIFIMGLRSGCVQLWSTHSEVRDPANPYCMFLIGNKSEHGRPITCMAAPDLNKAITGCKGGTVKVWDMACADLVSTHTFRFAHTELITGVNVSEKMHDLFATCSMDRSSLLWDLRQNRPATAIIKDHKVGFRHLAWQNIDEHLIYLGDECGYVHTLDMRTPNHFLSSPKYLDRPIHKIIPMGNKIAIIGDTNTLKVATENHHTIYENVESQDVVRDAIWQNSSKLMTVGYDGKLRVHKIEYI